MAGANEHRVRLEVRQVPGVESPFKPFWSPDGEWLGFGAGGKLWRVPASGGKPSAICDLPGSIWGSASGAAWQPDGTILFTTGDSGLYRVAATGGDPPVWSANGGRLFFANDDDIMEVEFSTEGTLQMGRPRMLFTHAVSGIATPFGLSDGFDVSADGERFYVARPLTDQPVVQNLAVVLNWTAEFE